MSRGSFMPGKGLGLERRRGAAQPVVRSCAAIGCALSTHAPLLMCVDHWRMVPVALRRQIWAAWKRVGKEEGARETHARAVREAVEAVHGKALAKKARRDAGTPDLFGSG